jgi:hypothetical protein
MDESRVPRPPDDTPQEDQEQEEQAAQDTPNQNRPKPIPAKQVIEELTPEEVVGWIAQKVAAAGQASPQEMNIIVNALGYDYTLLQTLVYLLIERNEGTYPFEEFPAPRLGVAVAVERQRHMDKQALSASAKMEEGLRLAESDNNEDNDEDDDEEDVEIHIEVDDDDDDDDVEDDPDDTVDNN